MASGFTLYGVPQFQARLAAIATVGDVVLMGAIGEEVALSARMLAPYKTGELSGDIHVSAVAPKMVQISTGVPYAPAQEFGAKQHVIPKLRKKKLLVFFWEKRGQMFVGPSVNHPGNPAHPFLRPAVFGYALALRMRAEVVALWNGGASFQRYKP